jgi:chromosome segregation ATPase
MTLMPMFAAESCMQEALTENERLRKTRIPADVERDLNGQIEKLTANIKGKERQIDDLNQEIRKLTSAKTDMEKTNTDLEVSSAWSKHMLAYSEM